MMIIMIFSKETNKEKEKAIGDPSVTLDLSKLSRTKKLQLLKRESPEFMPLLEDFKGKAAKAHPCHSRACRNIMEEVPIFRQVKDIILHYFLPNIINIFYYPQRN